MYVKVLEAVISVNRIVCNVPVDLTNDDICTALFELLLADSDIEIYNFIN